MILPTGGVALGGSALQPAQQACFPPNLEIFKLKASLHPNGKSQGAEIFNKCLPPTTCHISCVRCQLSQFFQLFFFGQSGGASRWRFCYHWGLSCQIFWTLSKATFPIGKVCQAWQHCHNFEPILKFKNVLGSECTKAVQ